MLLRDCKKIGGSRANNLIITNLYYFVILSITVSADFHINTFLNVDKFQNPESCAES